MTDTPEDDAKPFSRGAAASRARRIGGRPGRPKDETPLAEDAVVPEATTEDVGTEDVAPVDEESAPAAIPDPSPVRPRPRPKPAPSAPVSTTKPAKPAAPAKPAKPPVSAGQRAEWLPAAVLAVAALVFAILIAVFSISDRNGGGSKQRNQIREQVLAAAKTCTARENTYNYKTIVNDEAAALACTTGDFHKVVKDTFDKVLIPKAPSQQQTQQTSIDLAAIERISEDGKQWTLLVFGQSSVTNTGTGTSGPRVDPFAADVTMTKVGGKWLISRLDYA